MFFAQFAGLVLKYLLTYELLFGFRQSCLHNQHELVAGSGWKKWSKALKMVNVALNWEII